MGRLAPESLLDLLDLLLLVFLLGPLDLLDPLLPLHQSDPESPVPLVSQLAPSLLSAPGFPVVLWLPLDLLDLSDLSDPLLPLHQSDRLVRLVRFLLLHL